MTYGRCDDCRDRTHKYIVYEWRGKPLLRDAICPVHKMPLARTTRPNGKHGRLEQTEACCVARPR